MTGQWETDATVVSWRLVGTLAAAICLAGALLVAAAWAWTHQAAPTTPPPVISAAPAPPSVVAPPTTTVTITHTPPPAPVVVPQVPAAAQEICDMLRQYPGMKRVDVALTLVMDRHIYYDYDTARPIVDNAVANYCPDQAR